MIKPTELHYEFRRKFNRGDKEFNANVDVPDVDSYLNEAQELWFKNRVIAAQTNSEVRNDLRQFMVSKEVPTKRKSDEEYEVEYPKEIYKLLGIEALSEKKPCGERKLKVEIIQQDDLSELMRDPSVWPSFEYEETIAQEYSDGVILYARKDFVIKKGLLKYYRKPLKIATPSLISGGKYTNAAGEKVESDQGFEVTSTFAFRNVVDIAVLNALRDYNMIQDYSTQLDKILRKDLID
jgi:hypothetical protein